MRKFSVQDLTLAALLAAVYATLTPVSYTHLDVYKRQVLARSPGMYDLPRTRFPDPRSKGAS